MRPFLGLVMLDTRFPRIAGDIGHPSTFAFDVRPRVVPRASPDRVVRAADAALLAPFTHALQALEAEGAAAVATSCGFLARWQPALQAAVAVPVWSSALLLLADELRGQRCGVLTVDGASFDRALLAGAGAAPDTPVEGLPAGCALQRTLLEDRATLDAAEAERSVLVAAQRLLQRAPALDALVLECTNLPPYADALRQAFGLPVHDVTTMVAARWAGVHAGA